MTAIVLVFLVCAQFINKDDCQKLVKQSYLSNKIFCKNSHFKSFEIVISCVEQFLLNSRVFVESCAFFQTFKTFCSFDAPFSNISKKYRSFAIIHYSLVATSAVFAELKQFKAIVW